MGVIGIEGKPERSFLGKIFRWWFIIFNIFMAFWLYTGVTDSQESIDDSESEVEEVGCNQKAADACPVAIISVEESSEE